MVSFRENHTSSNLGRLLAGQSIIEALSNNKRLHESINKELIRSSQHDSSDITSSANTEEPGFLEMSRANVGLMSTVSLTGDPLSYATKLCRLLKQDDYDGSEFATQEVQTLDNLRGMVRQIFLKIKEQLDDDSHPLVWIISRFQDAFKRQVEAEIAQIRAEYLDEEHTMRNKNIMNMERSGRT